MAGKFGFGVSIGGKRPSTTPQQDTYSYRNFVGQDGKVTSPPEYPDTSFTTFKKQGGHAFGVGYNAWRDRRIAEYNTAYNMYKQYYDSMSQQVGRITEAGLNPNLAYGQATPGSSAGAAYTEHSGPSPEQVFGVGAQIAGTMFSGIKTLAEAATIINALPESKFKGNLAKQLNVAAAAGAINAQNGYSASLNNARQALGVGSSVAQREKADNAYSAGKSSADKALLDYMTQHDPEGKPSDFDNSMYAKSGESVALGKIVDYQKVKKEWDLLLSKPEYYDALLNKAINEAWITRGQAFQVEHVLNDPNMGPSEKFLALQTGIPGFIGKICYEFASHVIQTGKAIGDWLGIGSSAGEDAKGSSHNFNSDGTPRTYADPYTHGRYYHN